MVSLIMSLVVTVQQIIEPTIEVVIEGPSPQGDYSCIFEDDGVTGYFYALDRSKTENPIVDAILIYQYTQGNASNRTTELKILWDGFGSKCVLSFDGHLYGMFDFENRTGYSSTGFPEPDNNSGWTHVGSTEEALEALERDISN